VTETMVYMMMFLFFLGRNFVSGTLKSKTRKPCYRKENCVMRPMYGCPEKCR